MGEPYARVLADSISTDGHRLTTMEVQCHRFVLAEFNTHRNFSRNSASSRAIPVAKQLERVRTDMAVPLEWPREQKGMQGGALDVDAEQAETWWRSAGGLAATSAEALANLGVHKSVTNRLLEPFMWHTIVVTSTEWDNFFHQRCSPLAQPEIRAVAEKMQEAYKTSTPTLLHENEWHLPYIEREDVTAVLSTYSTVFPHMYREVRRTLAEISAARCARVSYLTQDGKRDISQDIALYNRLVSADPPHWSPLEHVATPWGINAEQYVNLYFYDGSTKMRVQGTRPRVGNLLGWRSLRTEAEMIPEK